MSAEKYAATLARAKAQMVEDVLAGYLPFDVADFAACHDHRDANGYGEQTPGGCDPDYGLPTWGPDGCMADEFMAAHNRLQADLDAWVKAGGLAAAAEAAHLPAEPDPPDFMCPLCGSGTPEGCMCGIG